MPARTRAGACPFGGLTPDGNWLVGNASAYLRGLSGDYYSRLYNAQTGAVVDDSYFGTGALGTDGGGNKHKAIAPAFSPDTTKLAFGDRERTRTATASPSST